MADEGDGTIRRRGRRPGDARERRLRVEAALAELTEAGVPFSMGDLAERAGISRATLYRDAGLRDLIGTQGDGPTTPPIDIRTVRRLERASEASAAERRELRKSLRESRAEIAALKERIEKLVAENEERRRAQRAAEASADDERSRSDAYAEGFAAGARAAGPRGGSGSSRGVTTGLTIAAARLPRASVLAARRTLARQLHPDLFATDPAASVLATELLKQLNELAGG